MGSGLLFTLGVGFILVGVAVLIFAIVRMGIKGAKQGNVKAAGVILVGPVPIIFGNDKKALKTVLALAVVITTLAIVATIIYYALVLS